MRLNKFIAETGVCSRREADKWIEAGRVTCNGQIAALGTQVAGGDEIRVDGELVGAKKKQIYLALNKPVGIICTTEPDVADNIIEFIGHRERIFPVGRLDKDSEGLILLTNDGEQLSHHPDAGLESADSPHVFCAGLQGAAAEAGQNHERQARQSRNGQVALLDRERTRGTIASVTLRVRCPPTIACRKPCANQDRRRAARSSGRNHAPDPANIYGCTTRHPCWSGR
jgi:hypothetical protein